MDKRSPSLKIESTWPFDADEKHLRGLAKVFEAESNRISMLAVEIDQLAPLDKAKRIDALEAWERLQVLDEIRKAH